ncbi:DNA topoisomerase 2 [Platanthera zijinensis]|uniref:DNA topoisomerase (ATP-hydrolyzing) n=1 Tax=Platanthera zijinensis TaxID=2320716 RepID=A0AAP0BS45_9ASPA
MVNSSLSCRRLAALTSTAVLLQIIGLSLFVIGLFPVMPSVPGVSGTKSYRMPTCEDLLEVIKSSLSDENDGDEDVILSQLVSFVNSINTIKGGTHVEYATSQIGTHVMNIVNRKNKNANLKPHNVRTHLWVFANALIDNPAFDSQTKETLTTHQGSFGSKCELSQDFLKKSKHFFINCNQISIILQQVNHVHQLKFSIPAIGKSGIVESFLSWEDFKQSKEHGLYKCEANLVTRGI